MAKIGNARIAFALHLKDGKGKARFAKKYEQRLHEWITIWMILKKKTGYESLKVQYMKKFPTLGLQDKNLCTMNENEAEGVDDEVQAELTNEVDIFERKDSDNGERSRRKQK